MSQSATLSPKNDSLVRDVVNRIVAESSPLRVILFGSRAQGTAHPMSDIDVLVVLPDGIDRRKAAVQIASRLPLYDVDVDLLVATPDVLARYADEPGLIFRTILQTGMDVYVA